jgi:hypothetical protein
MFVSSAATRRFNTRVSTGFNLHRPTSVIAAVGRAFRPTAFAGQGHPRHSFHSRVCLLDIDDYLLASRQGLTIFHVSAQLCCGLGIDIICDQPDDQ